MIPTPTEPAIESVGLTKQFGSIQALGGLDLRVPRGTVFGFLGPNGSGKTTALSILAGLASPSGGSARVMGLDVCADSMAVRQRIGFLRQDPRFYTWMTGRETLEFVGRFFDLSGAALARRAGELLDLVDLTSAADRKIGGFSGGMRQRLGIAQALMGSPQVLLLDEPCSSLDPAGRYEVIGIMNRLRGATTVFYSTHILQDVERVADQVAIISKGRCIRQAPMAELLAASSDELLVELEGAVEAVAADIRLLGMVSHVEMEPGEGAQRRLLIRATDLDAARRAVPRAVVARDDVLLISCKPNRPDLESVFLELTDGQSGDIR